MVVGIQPKKRTTIYVDPNIWNHFKKICSREEEAMSQKIEQYCARYVAVHSKGNPQTRIEGFMGNYQTSKTCFKCEGSFPNLIKVKFLSGLDANVCPDCSKDYDERGLIKKKLGVI